MLVSKIGIALLVGVASSFKMSIDPYTRTFRDELNRTRIMHGTNVVVKLAPYLPTTDKFDPQMSMTDGDLQNMQSWGINLVRLGVMWESVETSPGVYNMTYLQEVDKLIKRMGDRGIATIVDAHQDLFSRRTCGEGVPWFYVGNLETSCPKWNPISILFKLLGQCKSIEGYGYKKDANGNPLVSECLTHSFEDYFPSPEVISSFDSFYKNKNGVLDKFVNFWGVVSKHFASNPNVAGYDTFNEPWPADFIAEPSLLVDTGKFDKTILFPILQRIAKKIRENDQTKIHFFEPSQFIDKWPLLGGIVSAVGFPESPEGPA